MDRSDDRTAELRRAPQAVTEGIPPPRPQAERSDSGQHPYRAPQEPRFMPRIQYSPRIQNSPQPTFTPSPARPVTPSAPPQPASPRQSPRQQHERRPARAIIGDELRIPILWCQFGRCVAHYTDADALGERDLRLRALVAGWRYDLLGRLACPSCVQRDPTFWITCPPALVRRH